MRRPTLVEIRHLRAGLRVAMVAGDVRYDDQAEPVNTNTEHLRSSDKADG